MPKARQQYTADGSYVDKQLKEFTLTQEIIEKLDSIEPSAERNAIQGVKVNGELQTPDRYRVVSLTIPEVEDNLESYNNKASLSARQGRVLYNYIKNLQSLGRFLSNWNAATGLPMTNPSGYPYDYHTGDYFVISNVASSGGTNYRPDGAVYQGQPSTTVETEEIAVSDIYFYDGEDWLLMSNSARAIAIDTSLSTSSENPVENRVVTAALNTKQEKLIAGTNIQIATDGKTISATDTTYDNLPAAQGGTDTSLVTTGDKYNWDNKQDSLQAGANIQISNGTISATDTVYGAGANVQINNNIISATDTTYTAGDNIQISSSNVISATDTTYTAGTGINIDANNVISNTQTSAEWGNITGTLSDQTDLQNALNAKANDADVVHKTGAETITGVKTFGTTNTWKFDGTDATLYSPSSNGYLYVTRGGSVPVTMAIKSGTSGGTFGTTTNHQFQFRTNDTTRMIVGNSSAPYITLDSGSIPVVNDNSNKVPSTSWVQGEISGKQDKLIAGTNITIANDGKTISAKDTKYTAGDFDIADLSDMTELRTTWSAKQDAIPDLATIRSGASAGATAIQPGDDISELNNDAGYITSASLPTVNDKTITIQKNGTLVGDFTLNQSTNKSINITVPTTAADVGALPASTKYGASLSLSINSQTYVITAQLKDQDGNNLGGAQTVDLPLESVVVSGSYDATNKKVVLTLKDGSTIDFSVADLVSGLQSEITSTNKLSADLIANGTTNKVVTATEKSTWNAKQNALTTGTGISITNNIVTNTLPFNGASGGVKVFNIPEEGDNISEMLSWISSGGCCILKDGEAYYYTLQNTYVENELHFECPDITQGLQIKYIFLAYNSSNLVTQVDQDSSPIEAFEPTNTGSTGQILAKTAYGYKWQNEKGDIIVTQTEYDALPSSKTSDGNTYLIYE